MKIAIMQPTYLPWMGYFGLVNSVDIFVLLDSVQFEKRSWQQRNQILTQSGSRMLTIPVISKGRRDQKINDVEIVSGVDFRQKHISLITSSYRKSKYFSEVSELIFPIIRQSGSSLALLNINLIVAINEYLEIKTNIKLSSEIKAKGVKADLLCSICNKLGATKYIAVEGSRAYLQQSTAFKESQIDVEYFSFHHPVYEQIVSPFTPFMSVIDLMFNEGKNSKNIIKSGINE
jgi:hypothetical protein